MTKPHRATPDDWAQQEGWANRSVFSDSSCIVELRARIEALEAGATCPHVRSSDEGTSYCALAESVAAQQPPLFTAEEVARIVAPTSPAGSLVERVAKAIYDAPSTHEGWRSEARAAILEVAAWFRAERDSPETAAALEQEANR
jgi:hypothetical protein